MLRTQGRPGLRLPGPVPRCSSGRADPGRADPVLAPGPTNTCARAARAPVREPEFTPETSLKWI